MSLDKDLLRKAAGLPFETKKTLYEENISKVRTLDVETELLRVFTSTLRDIKRLKDIMEGRNNYSIGYQPPDSFRLKDEQGGIDKKYLFKLSMEKLDMIEEALSEVFNVSKNQEEEKEEEEGDE